MRSRCVRFVVLLVGLWLAPLADVCADVHALESAHYRLDFEGARSDAEEASRVLEAAWPSFRAFFGKEPTLKPGEKLKVRFYASREAWARGIREDGTVPPGSAGGLTSCPATENETAIRKNRPIATGMPILPHPCGNRVSDLAVPEV